MGKDRTHLAKQKHLCQWADKHSGEGFKLCPVVEGHYNPVKKKQCTGVESKGCKVTTSRDAPGTIKQGKRNPSRNTDEYMHKQEEIKLHIQMLNCDISDGAITVWWWDSLHNLSTAMPSYSLFKKGRQGITGGEVALSVKEQLEGM